MKGTARHVRPGPEGQKSVLRFRLETAEGQAVPVELRGAEIRGDVYEGDIIEVPAEVAGQGDAPVQLRQVRNLTTGSLVRAWDPSRIQQARSLVGREALSATVGAGVTLAVGGLQRIGQHDHPPNQTSSTSTPNAVSTTRSPATTSGSPTTTVLTSKTTHGGSTTTTSGIPPTTMPPVNADYGPRSTFLLASGLLLIGVVLLGYIYLRFERSRHYRGKKPLYPALLAFGIGVLLALGLLALLS
jgi:hypothetical protein